jgi:hypothetical protein
MVLTPRRLWPLFVALSSSFAPVQAANVPTLDSNPAANFSGGAGDTNVDTAWDDYYPPYEGNTTGAIHTDDNYSPTDPDLDPDSTSNQTVTAALGRRAAKDFYLRLMPLGASIVEGSRSTDGNGFRRWLREQLRWKGWKVNMVGSRQTGQMKDKVSVRPREAITVNVDSSHRIMRGIPAGSRIRSMEPSLSLKA